MMEHIEFNFGFLLCVKKNLRSFVLGYKKREINLYFVLCVKKTSARLWVWHSVCVCVCVCVWVYLN